MTDIEKRAHDIAISVLAKTMIDDKLSCLVKSANGKEKIDTFDVTDLYCTLYESFLKDLQEYGGF